MSKRKHHRRRSAEEIRAEETLVERTRATSRVLDLLAALAAEESSKEPAQVEAPRK